MFDIYDPSQMMSPPENDPMKELTDEERIRVTVYHIIGYIIAFIIAILICALFSELNMSEFIDQHQVHLCAFLIIPTPTHAYQRMQSEETVINSFDDILALQDRLECDIFISLPDEYHQRRVFLYDP